MKYPDLYARIVANSRLAIEDAPQSCWLWTGAARHGYPAMAVRGPGGRGPRLRAAHRAILEEVLGVEFPLDDAGHLCCESLCVHPDHLEPQTPAHNLSDRRGYAPTVGGASWIPVLFPRVDSLQALADWAWDSPGRSGQRCPF